jgi:hypothetical protein
MDSIPKTGASTIIPMLVAANYAMQQDPNDPTRFVIPEGIDASPAADPSVERAIIPSDPFPDHAAIELGRIQDAYLAANKSFDSSTMYGETVRARMEELKQRGVNPHTAEMRALQELEFNRPTISAQYYKSVTGDWPTDEAGEYPDFVSPNQLAKGLSVAIATMGAMQGESSHTPDQVYDAISKVMTNDREQLESLGSPISLMRIGEKGRDMVLDALNAHSPEGEWSDTSGVTDDELSGLQKKYGMNANFMYPDRLRANFDALRQYELFAAGTPRYEPGSNPMQMAGDLLHYDRQSALPMGMGGAEAAPSYISQMWTPKSEWAAKNAVYWYRQSQPNQGDKPLSFGAYKNYDADAAAEGYSFFRDPRDNSARYYRHSTLYPTGMDRGITEDTSRLHGRLSAYTMPYTMTPFTGDKGYITDVNLRTKRPVPVRPPWWKPEDVASNQSAVQGYEKASDDYAQASAAGYLGKNPTGFATTMMNMPRWAGDASTIADVAVTGGIGAGLGAMAKRPIRGAVTGMAAPVVGEAMQQTGFMTGISAATAPSASQYFFESAPNNSLQEVDPAHPRYWQKFRKKWESEVNSLDDAANAEAARKSAYKLGQ